MIKAVRSRQLLVFGLVGLVIVAGYIRWATDGNNKDVPSVPASVGVDIRKETESTTTSSHADYFTKARQQMDISRSEAIEVLQDILENSQASTEAKARAESSISNIARNIETEAIIENLIKLKGYEDVLIFVDENGVNAVIKSDGLESSNVAQINDIIISKTGFKADKIKITAKQ